MKILLEECILKDYEALHKQHNIFVICIDNFYENAHILWQMRTTITLDSKLLATLQQVSQTKTKAKAVLIAVQDYLRRHQVSKIKDLKGKIKFDLSADEIRHAQR